MKFADLIRWCTWPPKPPAPPAPKEFIVDVLTLIDCGVSPSMAKVFAEPITAALERFEIQDRREIAAWLAQFIHESKGFQALEEDLNYRAGGMMATWPTRFRTLESTRALMRDPAAPLGLRSRADPVKLANSVYGGRMGNTEPGDGWKYRGRGAGLTGKANYAAASADIGVDLVARPELAAYPETACLVFARYWTKVKNPITCSEAMAIYGSFDHTTWIINGGEIGKEHRRALFAECCEAVGV